MAGSFARRNTEFFLLDEITSKYLADEMRERGRERGQKWRWKNGSVTGIKDNWQRKREKLEGKEEVLDINKENKEGYEVAFIIFFVSCFVQVWLCQIFFHKK